MWRKTEYFQHIAHASMWLFVKAKLKEGILHPTPITERVSRATVRRAVLKIVWLENPRPVLSLRLVINFSILLLNTAPCRRWLWKQNTVSLLPAQPVLQSSRGKAAHACKTKPASSDRHSRQKERRHHRVTASTQRRWMIGCLKFPGPSKMSNIDSFVT